MKKALWLLLLVALIACGPSTADSQPADTNVAEETAVSTTEETSEETTEETAVTESEPFPPATNQDDFEPATSVEEAAVVREQDWRQGATDPLVVIIEYGDFQ